MATRTAYFLNGSEVERPLSLVLNNATIVPPTDDQLLSAGYEIQEVELEEPTPYTPSYEARVVELIRMRYTVDDELAILRQRATKPDEFADYNAYCEACKQQAKEELL